MTTPPDPYPWLPVSAVLDHLGVAPDSPEAARAGAAIERARLAAADYCERNRQDLFPVVDLTVSPVVRGPFTPGPAVVEAGVLAAARLYARKGSLVGLAAYAEFAAQILRTDPDVGLMLGVGRYAKPGVG